MLVEVAVVAKDQLLKLQVVQVAVAKVEVGVLE
jgi:hypothetical protein